MIYRLLPKYYLGRKQNMCPVVSYLAIVECNGMK